MKFGPQATTKRKSDSLEGAPRANRTLKGKGEATEAAEKESLSLGLKTSGRVSVCCAGEEEGRYQAEYTQPFPDVVRIQTIHDLASPAPHSVSKSDIPLAHREVIRAAAMRDVLTRGEAKYCKKHDRLYDSETCPSCVNDEVFQGMVDREAGPGANREQKACAREMLLGR